MGPIYMLILPRPPHNGAERSPPRAEQDLAWTCSTSFTLPRSPALKPLLLPQAKTMAEVMNLFCSPSPAPSAPLPRPTPAGGGDGDEDEDPVPDFGIPALHPDLPMCASASPQGPRRTAKGIKLALLHTLPVSQVRAASRHSGNQAHAG